MEEGNFSTSSSTNETAPNHPLWEFTNPKNLVDEFERRFACIATEIERLALEADDEYRSAAKMAENLQIIIERYIENEHTNVQANDSIIRLTYLSTLHITIERIHIVLGKGSSPMVGTIRAGIMGKSPSIIIGRYNPLCQQINMQPSSRESRYEPKITLVEIAQHVSKGDQVPFVWLQRASQYLYAFYQSKKFNSTDKGKETMAGIAYNTALEHTSRAYLCINELAIAIKNLMLLADLDFADSCHGLFELIRERAENGNQAETRIFELLQQLELLSDQLVNALKNIFSKEIERKELTEIS